MSLHIEMLIHLASTHYAPYTIFKLLCTLHNINSEFCTTHRHLICISHHTAISILYGNDIIHLLTILYIITILGFLLPIFCILHVYLYSLVQFILAPINQNYIFIYLKIYILNILYLKYIIFLLYMLNLVKLLYQYPILLLNLCIIKYP